VPLVGDMSVQLTDSVIEPASVPPEELEPDDELSPDPDELDVPPPLDPDELTPLPDPDEEPPPDVDSEPESFVPNAVASPDPVDAGRHATLASQTTLRTPR